MGFIFKDLQGNCDRWTVKHKEISLKKEKEVQDQIFKKYCNPNVSF